MGFFLNTFLGVRVFIWVFLGVALLLFSGVLLYFYREKIKEKYIKFRWPEKVIKVIIHYPSSQYFSVFWRLIPDREDFSISGKTYLYSDIAVLKKNDSYAFTDKEQLKIKVWGKEYNLDKNYKIKNKGDKWAEIHYIYGVPNPIDFYHIIDESIKFTSKDLELFKENDLFQKLLTLQGEKSMLMFLMLLGIGNLMVGLFIVAKLMGWIKG